MIMIVVVVVNVFIIDLITTQFKLRICASKPQESSRVRSAYKYVSPHLLVFLLDLPTLLTSTVGVGKFQNLNPNISSLRLLYYLCYIGGAGGFSMEVSSGDGDLHRASSTSL